MQLRSLLLLLVFLAAALFAAVNWNAFTTPTTLSLVVSSVQAPLGLIMLGLTALLTLLFLAFVVFTQTSMLVESRRQSRELRAQRELADQAEASRFTELRGFVEAELQKLAKMSTESHSSVLARVDKLEQALRAAVELSGNILGAHIGELNDRLERTAGGANSARPV